MTDCKIVAVSVLGYSISEQWGLCRDWWHCHHTVAHDLFCLARPLQMESTARCSDGGAAYGKIKVQKCSPRLSGCEDELNAFTSGWMNPPVAANSGVSLHSEGPLIPDSNRWVTMVLDIASCGQFHIEDLKYLIPPLAVMFVNVGVVYPEIKVGMRIHGLLIFWFQVVVKDIRCCTASQHTCDSGS